MLHVWRAQHNRKHDFCLLRVSNLVEESRRSCKIYRKDYDGVSLGRWHSEEIKNHEWNMKRCKNHLTRKRPPWVRCGSERKIAWRDQERNEGGQCTPNGLDMMWWWSEKNDMRQTLLQGVNLAVRAALSEGVAQGSEAVVGPLMGPNGKAACLLED